MARIGRPPTHGDTADQAAAILAVLDGGGDYSITALMAALSDHPAWRKITGKREQFRNLLHHRLYALRDLGLISDRHKKLRVVRRRRPRAGAQTDRPHPLARVRRASPTSCRSESTGTETAR
jgi:hypothetical protein